MIDARVTASLSADISDARLARLTQELARDLSRAGIQARPIEVPPMPGEKGEPITLGVLVLALITGGTVKAVIDCFRAYISRENTLTIKLARADGTHVEITAHNIDMPFVREAVEAATSAASG